MGDPLALLYSLGAGTESHEVASDDVLGVLAIDPERKGPRQVVRTDDVVPAGNGAAGFVHADGLGERRRIRQWWHFGSDVCGRLVSLREAVRENCLACGQGGRALWLTRRFVRATSKTSVAERLMGQFSEPC